MVVDYSAWQTRPIRVTNLRLDPENPRIPPAADRPTQMELIHYFCHYYKVYELARSIAEDGYFPDEKIVVAEENDEFYVLEGNRRVAALKLLLNSDLAPDDMKDRFSRLTGFVDHKKVAECEATIAPSREAATKLILEKHTQQSVLQWSPLMQAGFYHNKLTKHGASIDELSRSLNLPAANIQNFLRMSDMYHLAASMDLPQDVQDKVLDPQNFPISVLERLYDSPEMRKQLTLSDDLSTISCEPDQFKKAYSKIVTDIATHEQDTRKLNTGDDIRKYAQSVKDYAGIKDTGKPIPLESLILQPLEQKRPAEHLRKNAAKRSTRRTRGLFSASAIPFKLEGAASLKLFHTELKGLPVATYPNASAILLRVFADKACRHFLKRKGIQTIPVGQQNRKLADASFGELLDYLAQKSNPLISDDNIKKAIRTFKSGSSFKSLSSLNTIIHNEEVSFTEQQVRDLLPNLEGLLKILLTE